MAKLVLHGYLCALMIWGEAQPVYRIVVLCMFVLRVLQIAVCVPTVRSMFEQLDKDGDGQLDRAELKMVADAIGHRMSNGELDTAMTQLDHDGNGEVDFDEFFLWCASLLRVSWEILVEC